MDIGPPNSFRPNLMSQNEIRIIIETFLRFNDDRVNFLGLVEFLKEHNVIDDATYTNKLRQYRHLCHAQREKQLRLEFQYILSLTFDEVLTVIRDMGCHEIARELVYVRYGNYVGQMSRAAVRNVEFTFTYYEEMSSNIAKRIFVDIISYLQTQIEEQKVVMCNTSNAVDKRQKAANRVASLYALLVDHHWSREDRIRMLEDMKSSVPSTLDTFTVNAFFHSKMAITEAIVGDRAKAIEHAHTAETMCYNREHCFSSVLTTHYRQLVRIHLYMNTFQSKDLINILRLGDDVIEMVKERNDDGQKQWKMLVLIFKAMSLLTITPQFDVIERTPRNDINGTEGSLWDTASMTEIDMNIIEGFLKDVRWISNKSNERTNMIYLICKARFKELSGNLEAAVTYLDEAIILADGGGVFFVKEKENIDRYMARLRADKGLTFGNTKPLYQRCVRNRRWIARACVARGLPLRHYNLPKIPLDGKWSGLIFNMEESTL